MALRSWIADKLMPWAAGNATVWPSQHDTHRALVEELKTQARGIKFLSSMMEGYRQAWIAAEAENTALRIRLGKLEVHGAKGWQAFNSLEKPVTDHIEHCMDAELLDRAHRITMERFGPNG